MPDAKPLILKTAEVRQLLEYGQVEIRRPLRPGPIALRQRWNVGQVLWVREGFASRRDITSGEIPRKLGDLIRVRAAVERGPGEEVVRVVPIAPGLLRFATRSYRSWPGKFMPRPFSRLTVELLEVRQEPAGDCHELVLRIKVVSEVSVLPPT